MTDGEFEAAEERARQAGRTISASPAPAHQRPEQGGMLFSILICSAVMTAAAIAFLAA